VSRGRLFSNLVLALLVGATGFSAWLGVDGSPQETPTLLELIAHSTTSTHRARFSETSSQSVLGSSGYPSGAVRQNFALSATGSIDFDADAVARRTTVLQAGQPEQSYQTYFTRRVLYERIEGFGRLQLTGWTEQPSAIDPMLAIPGLAVLRSGGPQRLRRVGYQQIGDIPTTEYRLVPNLEAVCTVPGQSTERLLTSTLIWVDHHDVLRRTFQVEQSWIVSRQARFELHLLTRDSVTLSGFGEAMAFGRPTHVRPLPGASSPPTSASSASRPSCRTLSGHGVESAGSGEWIAVSG
jgi:hypothetical protein